MDRTVLADDRGVWSTGPSGRPYGIEWADIYSVGGYKLDGVTEVYTCVCLEFEYGEFFEMDDSVTGFASVVEAITRRLPGIPADWFDRIDRLSTGDAPLDVWSPSSNGNGDA